MKKEIEKYEHRRRGPVVYAVGWIGSLWLLLVLVAGCGERKAGSEEQAIPKTQPDIVLREPLREAAEEMPPEKIVPPVPEKPRLEVRSSQEAARLMALSDEELRQNHDALRNQIAEQAQELTGLKKALSTDRSHLAEDDITKRELEIRQRYEMIKQTIRERLLVADERKRRIEKASHGLEKEKTDERR